MPIAWREGGERVFFTLLRGRGADARESAISGSPKRDASSRIPSTAPFPWLRDPTAFGGSGNLTPGPEAPGVSATEESPIFPSRPMSRIPHATIWPDSPLGDAGLEDLAFSHPQWISLPGSPEITGSLRLRGMKRLQQISEGWFAGHSLFLTGCPALRALPAIARPLRRLVLDGTGIEFLPDDLPFEEGAVLVLQNCSRLQNLPAAAGTGRLARIVLRNCPRVKIVPDLVASGNVVLSRWRGVALENTLKSRFVKIHACPELESIPGPWSGGQVTIEDCPKLTAMSTPAEPLRRLVLENCPALPNLPDRLRFQGHPAELLLKGCGSLTTLHSDLSAEQSDKPSLVVEIASSPLRNAPAYPFPWRIRVRGVLLEPQEALHPDAINPVAVLAHPNAEVRRVLLENMGLETLLARVAHAIIDEDTDPGGRRRLIHFQLPDSPPRSHSRSPALPIPSPQPGSAQALGEASGRLMARVWRALFGVRPAPAPRAFPRERRFLECRCPSTGRQYLLPVPPSIRTCHAAAAWMAGFENPHDYAPVLET